MILSTTLPLTQRQGRCLLEAFTASLATVLETMRSMHHDHRAPTTTRSDPLKLTPTPVPPNPPTPAPPCAPASTEFPLVSRGIPQRRGPPPVHRLRPSLAPATDPHRQTLSYVDRLRSQHEACDGESRRHLTGRILTAPPPLQRRLIPPSREPHARLSSELAGVRVVYVRGLLRMLFREMRGYLRDLSSTLTPRSILSISYFGTITSFICIIESTVSVRTYTLTDIGGRVDSDFHRGCPFVRINKMR